MRSEGKIRFENMDCLDLLKQLPDKSIDLLLQDPPYNTTNCEWDKQIDFPELWKEWERVCKPNAAMIFTASQPFTTDLINSNRKLFRYELIWDKIRAAGFLNANRMPLKTHENILVFYRELPTYNPQKMDGRKYDKTKYNGKKLDKNVIGSYTSESSKNDGERFPVSIMVFSQDWTRQEQIHPTQKPIDLMRYLILSYSNEGDTIFDGYAGSATVAMACIEENRNCICSEKETEYFNLGTKRIENALCQTKLF
jgi:site-specific DNA-methyltransferase (adenine-specific)